MASERVEVGRIARVVGKSHIERGGRLAEGVVLRAVHREGEHVGVVGEDGGGAVAVMHVEIDDERAADPAGALEDADRDGDVVEHAEAFGPAGHGVVRAAGEVAREPLGERHQRGVDRPLHGDAGAPDERWAPRQPHPPFLVAALCAPRQFIEVVPRVDEQQVRPVGLARRNHVLRSDHAFAEQQPMQCREFPHREGVARRERHEVVVAVRDAHDSEDSGRRTENGLPFPAHWLLE